MPTCFHLFTYSFIPQAHWCTQVHKCFLECVHIPRSLLLREKTCKQPRICFWEAPQQRAITDSVLDFMLIPWLGDSWKTWAAYVWTQRGKGPPVLSNFRKRPEHLYPLPRAQAEMDKLLQISVLVGRCFLVHPFTEGAAIEWSWQTRYGGRSQLQLLAQNLLLSPHVGVKTPSILILTLL